MDRLRGRVKTRRGVVVALGTALVVAAGAFAVVYFLLLPTSSPKRFQAASPKAAAPLASGAPLAGRWTVAGGSKAGYRVREKLAFLPAQSDAVGRTSAITGEAALSNARGALAVTSASFTVDVSKLTSDKSMRDERIHTIGLQSDQYPKATFMLSTPAPLPASALNGRVVHVPATGVFNIHGTAKRETVPLEMRLSKSSIQAVGSITFPWSEFAMTAPSIGSFVNVTDKATLEFDLHLRPA